MLQVRQEMIRFCRFISTPLTNMGRLHNAKSEGRVNNQLREAIISTGGWSINFPMQAVEMSYHWPFGQSVDMPNGVTAQQFIDNEMRRRRLLDETIRKSEDADKAIVIQAFEDVFYTDVCDADGIVSGRKLFELTIEDALWVHSGHQRTESDFFDAYVEFTRRVKEEGYTGKFSLEVPCNVQEFQLEPTPSNPYVGLEDILKDQIGINMVAGVQNALGPLDLCKAAVQAIGHGEAPKVDEREFRRFCAAPGVTSKDGGNDGGYPRYAYLLAIINYYYRQGLKFYESLVSPEFIKKEGVKEKVGNPDWINFKDVAVKHVDWAHDASVIARLMEPGLEKLTAYNNTYGPFSKNVLEKGKENQMSAIETEVLRRGYPWTVEEARAWVTSMKPFGGAYKPAITVEKAKPFDVDTLKAVVKSAEPSMFVREYLGEKVGQVIPGPGVNADSPPPKGAVEWSLQNREILDFVYSTRKVDELSVKLTTCLKELALLKDGNPAAYVLVLGSLEESLNTIPLQVGLTQQDSSPAGEGTTVGGIGNQGTLEAGDIVPASNAGDTDTSIGDEGTTDDSHSEDSPNDEGASSGDEESAETPKKRGGRKAKNQG